ncbi:hypothetical protein Glove_637g30 [Diversispora epigaea]|uniref:Uncharacterized protein n=1 Tax=Diversispora epigaea TaxID=1348612 RepID=A0A397G7Q0_9GLOM|nr:hypothetical protein Glove_637g30 [Diversispora epigaea]
MSSYKEINAFQAVTVPNTKHVQDNIKSALDGFNQIAKIEVRNPSAEFQHDTVQAFVGIILDEGKNFCKLTHKSVTESNNIANYCTDILSYVEVLLEQRISGEEFQEALEVLLWNANECKNEAVNLWKGYTRICENLRDIHSNLYVYDKYLENKKDFHEKNIVMFNKKKKEARTIKWTCRISSAGMTALAPVTVGISLFGAAAFDCYANEKAEKEKECRLSRDESRAMVEKLNSIRYSVDGVITQTGDIIEIINHFQVFWDKRVIEVKCLIEDFKKKKGGMLGYNRLTGRSVIKKWTEVRGQYTSYSKNVLYLLNNTTVNRRIALESF